MNNLQDELAILSNCKTVNTVSVLSLAKKGKRGRKPNSSLSDEEIENTHYCAYITKCNTQNRPVLDRKAYDTLNTYYGYDELLTTQDIESTDVRYKDEPEYVKKGFIGEALDHEAYDSLYKVLIKALKNRLVIILNLESVPALLNNALIYCSDIYLNCEYINSALNAKLNEIRTLLSNSEIQAWIKSGVSDMSLYKDEIAVRDYISTYQKVLRQLTDIRGESLEYIKDIFHNDLDLFEDEILANDEPDIERYFEDSDSDDLEDIVEQNL